MSSLYSGFSQIAGRIQYLVAIASGTGFTQSALSATLQTYSNQVLLYDGYVLNAVNSSTLLTAIPTRAFLSGTEFRDMGKLLVIQSNGQDVYKFRLVQVVNGGASEGVPADYLTNNFYICIWSADPVVKPVIVGRIG